VEISSDIHRNFMSSDKIRCRPTRKARMVWSIVVMTLVGLKSGCGIGPSSEAPMVKDPAPLAPEETTEALIKAKPKTKPGVNTQRR
jgi:hypothetical protein